MVKMSRAIPVGEGVVRWMNHTIRNVSKRCLRSASSKEASYLLDVQDSHVFQACISIVASVLAFVYLRNLLKRRRGPHACKRIGLHPATNLADEHNPRYDGARQKREGGLWKVKSLYIYPIKSCKGVELSRGAVTGRGMEYDRQFSFAQYTTLSYSENAAYGWKFVTQREIPALAKVTVEMWIPDSSSSSYSQQHPNVQSEGVVVIRWPSYSQGAPTWYKAWKLLTSTTERSVHIPFRPTLEQIKSNGFKTQNLTVWKDTTPALLLGCTGKGENSVGADMWVEKLRCYLDEECHRQNPPFEDNKGQQRSGCQFDGSKAFALFRVGDQQPRKVYRNAPRKDELGYQSTIDFQDSYPLHILNLASVHNVASKLTPGAPPLSIKNFRPNVIMVGGEAYEEDEWKYIRMGHHEYHVSCRTTRCLLPNVDTSTGKSHRLEPYKTLSSFRCVDKGAQGKACLGMQIVPRVEERTEIKVGDEIEVLETGAHFYIKQ